MGNILPLPCMCKEARVVHATVAGAKKVKRKEWPAAAKNVFVDREDQDRGDDEGVEKMPAWPRCRMQEVAAGEDGAVRLKVVMTRKNAAEFMARLEERSAAERKARMGCLSHGGAMTGPCRDAWRPRLTTIHENC